MNKTLYLLVLAVLCLAPLSADAQKNKHLDRDAAIEALRPIIRSNSTNKATPMFIDRLANQFKKDPAFFVGVADIWYMNAADTAQAFANINKAIEIDPTYSPAYAKAGFICMRRHRLGCNHPLNAQNLCLICMPSREDTLEALSWYEKGIEANPKAIECYEEYSNLIAVQNTDKAEAMLKKLATADPTYPVDLIRGRMYYNIARMGSADNDPIKLRDLGRFPHLNDNLLANYKMTHMAFRNVDYKHLERNDYKMFQAASFTIGERGYAVDTICVMGLKYFPRDAEFNRSGFSYARQIGEAYYPDESSKPWFEKALKYADELLHNSDSAKITSNDIFNIATVYNHMKDYSGAIKAADDAIAFPGMPEDEKNKCMQIKIGAYIAMSEYEQAVAAYNEYNAKKEENGTLTSYDMEQVVLIYDKQAKEYEKTDTAKCNYIYRTNIIPLYEQIYNKFDDVTSKKYALFNLTYYNMKIDNSSDDTFNAAYRQIDYYKTLPQSEMTDNYIIYYARAWGLMAYCKLQKTKTAKGWRLSQYIAEAGEYAVNALDLNKAEEYGAHVYDIVYKNLPRKLRRHDDVLKK